MNPSPKIPDGPEEDGALAFDLGEEISSDLLLPRKSRPD